MCRWRLRIRRGKHGVMPTSSPRPGDDALAARAEHAVLRASIIATVLVAALGIVAGLASGSFAVVFDGVYSLFDALASIVALLVARMIADYAASGERSRELSERFTMGVWHLEPMVLAVTGLLLIGATCYALINAIDSFLSGGREMQFGMGIAYAVVTLVVSVALALYGWRANRRLVPYVDPAVLALVCVLILPIPYRTVRRAMADVLMVTPPLLKQHVDEVARHFVRRLSPPPDRRACRAGPPATGSRGSVPPPRPRRRACAA